MSDLLLKATELIDPSRLNFSKYLEEFIAEQDIKENSKGTYKRALTQFFLFMSNKPFQPTSNDILEYKQFLNSQGLAAYTTTAYLVVVRKFFSWMESKKIYPNIAKNIKGMKSPRGFRKECLSNSQIKRVLKEIDQTTIQGKRDFALINLLLRTGLRTIEIQRADISDIVQYVDEAKLYIQGKGRDAKDEYVFVTYTALKPILDYLKLRGQLDDSEPLFASISDRNNGSRMTTRSISRIVKEALIRAGIDDKRLSAHSLRHTAITNALLGGATLQEVKTMARHANINTTLIYSHNLERMANPAERVIDRYMEEMHSVS
jgi:integrase/recombinase XerC/integrase/recombinase XerD